MTRILLLSDTHSYIDDNILKYVKQADQVWHAGDIGNLKVTDAIEAVKPLTAVYGNIDDARARLEFKEDLWFTCEGVEVFMTHIGGYLENTIPEFVRRLNISAQSYLFVVIHIYLR